MSNDHTTPDDTDISSTYHGGSDQKQPTGERRSFWRRTYADARNAGGWFEVPKFYTGKTARQVASDVRCASKRNEHNRRTQGIRPGEIWEARWEPVTGGAEGDCRVFIRLVDTSDQFPGNDRFATAG